MQTLLLQYSDTCFHSLVNNLKWVNGNYSVDTVHNLRLSIKRIRALLTLVDHADSLKQSKQVKQIDSLFLLSGQLRDIHVQISLLETYRDKVGTEVDHFEHIIKKGKKRVVKRLESSVLEVDFFDIVIFNQRLDCLIEQMDSSQHEKNCRLRVEMLYEQIIQQITKDPSEKTLHRIRIMLKELIYALSVFKKGKMSTDFSADEIKNLNSLQQELGSWHDRVILLSRITKEKNKQNGILFQRVKSDISILQTAIISNLLNLHYKL
jgi:CHAD domain-containing protein